MEDEVQEPTTFEDIDIQKMVFSINEDGEFCMDIEFNGKEAKGD